MKAVKRLFDAFAYMFEVFFSPNQRAEVMKPEEDPQVTALRGFPY
jgi:hypothetical protein